MNPLFQIQPSGLRRGRRILAALEADLAESYQDALLLLRGSTRDPVQVEALEPVLHKLAILGKTTRECRDKLALDCLSLVGDQLALRARELIDSLQSEPESHIQARRLLTKMMQHLMLAEGEFRNLRLTVEDDHADNLPKKVVVCTDLLYQCYQSLLPAERMLVVAGRSRDGKVVLSAVFDVTGPASTGHVRADPQRLSQALVAMSATDTHLAAWFHSHPGTGQMSTCPSNTDLRQHQDWIRDYSARLLSGIFVQDRYLRFWGSAIEQKHIIVELEGTGVVPTEGDGNVFHIFPS